MIRFSKANNMNCLFRSSYLDISLLLFTLFFGTPILLYAGQTNQARALASIIIKQVDIQCDFGVLATHDIWNVRFHTTSLLDGQVFNCAIHEDNNLEETNCVSRLIEHKVLLGDYTKKDGIDLYTWPLSPNALGHFCCYNSEATPHEDCKDFVESDAQESETTSATTDQPTEATSATTDQPTEATTSELPTDGTGQTEVTPTQPIEDNWPGIVAGACFILGVIVGFFLKKIVLYLRTKCIFTARLERPNGPPPPPQQPPPPPQQQQQQQQQPPPPPQQQQQQPPPQQQQQPLPHPPSESEGSLPPSNVGKTQTTIIVESAAGPPPPKSPDTSTESRVLVIDPEPRGESHSGPPPPPSDDESLDGGDYKERPYDSLGQKKLIDDDLATAYNFVRDSDRLVEKWKLFGLQLSVTTDILGQIDHERLSPSGSMLETLKKWLEMNPTWSDFIDALKAVGESDLAAKVRAKYYDDPQGIEETAYQGTQPTQETNEMESFDDRIAFDSQSVVSYHDLGNCQPFQQQYFGEKQGEVIVLGDALGEETKAETVPSPPSTATEVYAYLTSGSQQSYLPNSKLHVAPPPNNNDLNHSTVSIHYEEPRPTFSGN